MAVLLRNWQDPETGRKKFIASVLLYHLSKKVNRNRFEVVQEGYLDLADLNSEQPDIIIYDKEKGYHPVLLIEMVHSGEWEKMAGNISILKQMYQIEETFLYNLDLCNWSAIDTAAVHSGFDYSRTFNLYLDRVLNEGLNNYRK
ncbi:MAG: hypothetical protein KBB64_00255 [Bacteroidia bacterium]|jgi:hypothetical protein|nr:hypothetical protein [Bacteroidia bacterium]